MSNSPFLSFQPTASEQAYFTQLFGIVDVHGKGVVNGMQAVPFFRKSGLDGATLGKIWQLADQNNQGFLKLSSFMVALKLVALAQSNKGIELKNLDLPTPLPQFENMVTPKSARPESIAVTSSPHLMSSTTTKLNPPLTQATADKYLNIFVKASSDGVTLEGNSVKSIMMKSQLPVDHLKDIWSLADMGNKGHLDAKEFIIAMYYVEALMSQTLTDLPVVLPPQLTTTAQSSVNSSSVIALKKSSFTSPQRNNSIRQSSIPSMVSPPNPASITPSYSSMDSIFMAPNKPSTDKPWAVSQEEQVKFTNFFESAILGQDKNYLTSEEAYEFFARSKLSKPVLAHIWELADITKNNTLNRDEFILAMHLIYQKLAGNSLPDDLPPELVPPSMRTSRQGSMENEFDMMMMGGNTSSLERHRSLSPGMSRIMPSASQTFPRMKPTVGAPTSFEDIISTNNRNTFYQPSSVSPINLPITSTTPTAEDIRQKQDIIDTHGQIVKFTQLLADIQPKNQHLDAQVNELSNKKQVIMQQMEVLNSTLKLERDDFDEKSNQYNQQLVPELEQIQSKIQELQTKLAPNREEQQNLVSDIEKFQSHSSQYKFHINKATEMVTLLRQRLEQKQAEEAKLAESQRQISPPPETSQPADTTIPKDLVAGSSLIQSPESITEQGSEKLNHVQDSTNLNDDTNPFEDEPTTSTVPEPDATASPDPFTKIISKKTTQPPRPARPPRSTAPPTPAQPQATPIPEFANFDANFPSSAPTPEAQAVEKNPVRRPHQIEVIKNLEGLSKAFENFKPENDFIQIKVIGNLDTSSKSPFDLDFTKIFNADFIPEFDDDFNAIQNDTQGLKSAQNHALASESSLFLGDSHPFESKVPNFEANHHDDGWTDPTPSNLDLDQVFGGKRESIAGSVKFEDVFGDSFFVPPEVPEQDPNETPSADPSTVDVPSNPDDSIILPDTTHDMAKPLSDPEPNPDTEDKDETQPQQPFEYPPLPVSPLPSESDSIQDKKSLEIIEEKSSDSLKHDLPSPSSQPKPEEPIPSPTDMDRTVSSTAGEINLADGTVELEPIDPKLETSPLPTPSIAKQD